MTKPTDDTPDIKPDEVKPEEDKVLDAVEGNLDEIHDAVNRELTEETPDDLDDKPDDETPDEKTDEDGDDNDATDEKPEASDPEPTGEVAEPSTPAPSEAATSSAPTQLPPVKVKSYDGKVHEFHSLDEIPEDFEPSSYKEFARFTQEMMKKEAKEEALAQEAKVTADKQARQGRIDEIKKAWDEDIASLDDKLPKEKDLRQETIDGVFELMNKELSNGRVIDFAPAYEIYQFRKSQDDKQEEIKKTVADKKTRGAMIQGQGPGGVASKPKIIEGPPQGTSLDDVHEHVLNSL
jgi:hypothetical protein